MKKAKRVRTSIVDQAALDEATLKYRRLATEVANAKLEMENRKAQIEQEYSAAVHAGQDAMDEIFEDIQSWAVLNKAARFSVVKSFRTAGAVIGFRNSPPAVKQVRGVKTEHSIERLIALAPGYVRTVDEINKEAILADSKTLTPEFLASAGLFIDQDEKFFLEPVSEVLETQSQPVNV